jgi:Spy/CpxP family protein refolding chaperone
MNRQRYGALAIIALLCGVGGYWTAAARGPAQTTRPVPAAGHSHPPGNLVRWLALTPEQAIQVAELEAGFAAERATLEAALEAERDRLASLFENSTADADAIRRQLEHVIEAHDALERRVMEYVLELRPHLSAEQRARLFDRFAEGVRDARGWRWRHGRSNQAEHQGGGPPPGRGPAWRRDGGGPPGHH